MQLFIRFLDLKGLLKLSSSIPNLWSLPKDYMYYDWNTKKITHITFNTYQKSSGNVGTIRTISGSKSHHNSPKMNAFFIRNMTKFEFVISTRLNNSRVAKIKLRCIQIGHVFLVCTGKSLSEGLILGSTNPQYDKRLFINLPVQYMKTTSSEHGENMLCA